MVLAVSLVACRGPTPPTESENELMWLEVSPESTSVLASGRSGSLIVEGHFADGTVSDVSPRVTWRSKESAIATISGRRWQARDLGVTTLTAQLGEQSVDLTVRVLLPEPERLELSLELGPLPLGISTRIAATAVYTDGTRLDVTPSTTFTTTNNQVLTVEADAVRAMVLGTGTIAARYQSFVETLQIEVVDASATQLSIDALAPVTLGQTAQLNARARWSNGTTGNASRSVTWTSGDESIVTVSSNGEVTALRPGNVQVTAQLENHIATTTVVVSNTSLTDFRLESTTLAMTQGTPVRFKALATFSDGIEVDVTNQTRWSGTCAEYRVSDTAPTQGTVTQGFVGTWSVIAVYGRELRVGTVVISAGPTAP